MARKKVADDEQEFTHYILWEYVQNGDNKGYRQEVDGKLIIKNTEDEAVETAMKFIREQRIPSILIVGVDSEGNKKNVWTLKKYYD